VHPDDDAWTSDGEGGRKRKAGSPRGSRGSGSAWGSPHRGADVAVRSESRSPRGSYPVFSSPEASCHWDRHRIAEAGRKGRQLAYLACAVCRTAFCYACTSNRFTSVDGEAAAFHEWEAAGRFWVCFVCSGECNCSGKGKHYYGRVATRPTGDLSGARKAHPDRTPNEVLMGVDGMRAAYAIERGFPGADEGRFPHFRAGEHHLADLDADRVRELKAAYPRVVRAWVAARAARAAPVTDLEADIADLEPTLEAWTTNWGLGAPEREKVEAAGGWEKAADVRL